MIVEEEKKGRNLNKVPKNRTKGSGNFTFVYKYEMKDVE